MYRIILLTLFLYFFVAPIDAQSATGVLLTTDGAQNSILLISLESGEQTRFSVGTGIHTAWGFSPDGCRVLLTVMDGSGLARAYTTRVDGSDARELVTLADFPVSQWGVWEPTWSPQGDKIAFTLLRDGFEGQPERSYHIAWVSPDGGEPTFYSVTGAEHTPIWSPDGSQLAYVSYDKRAPGERFDLTAEPDIATQTPPEALLNEADLWIVGADGTGKYRATTFETGSVRAPRWSPNEEWISFIMSPSGNNDTLWMVKTEADAKAIPITHRYSLTLDHTWLPDSSALLISARSVNDTQTAALWVFPPQLSSDDAAMLYAQPEQLPYPDYPSFSPDGSLLAFRSGYQIGVMNSNGLLQFLPETDGNMPLYWSPTPLITSEDCVD